MHLQNTGEKMTMLGRLSVTASCYCHILLYFRLAGQEWLLTGETTDEYYPEIGVVSYYLLFVSVFN